MKVLAVPLRAEAVYLNYLTYPHQIALQSYATAVASLWGRGAVLILMHCNASLADTIFSSYSTSYEGAVKKLQTEKICSCIRELIMVGDMRRSIDSHIHIQLCERCLQVLYVQLHHMEMYTNSYSAFTAPLRFQIQRAYTPQMLIRALCDFVQKTIDACTQASDASEHPSIRIAKHFIHENYATDLSLAQVAEIVHLNAIYFSVLFKRETGVNFTDYINKIRIKSAKQLLKNLALNVNEVASMIGFDNSKYFSQVFKKQIGITPTDFRRRQLQGGNDAT